MTPKKGTASSATYGLTGNTLPDINRDAQNRGPQDPNGGGREFGSCKGVLTIAATGGQKDFDFKTTPNKTPTEVTATLKTGTITLATTILMPKLNSDKNLSQDALKEWKRFLGCLQTHESGHATSYFTLAGTIAKEIEAETATGTGKDEKTAQLAAAKALLAQIGKDYSASELSKRIKADAAAYDSQTGSGANQGAVLDTSIN